MFRTAALTAFTFAAVVLGQQAGTLTTENHPALSIQQCTATGCTTQQKSVVLDSNWRWTHSTAGATVSRLLYFQARGHFSIPIAFRTATPATPGTLLSAQTQPRVLPTVPSMVLTTAGHTVSPPPETHSLFASSPMGLTPRTSVPVST